jgi:hypothetical protein
MIVQQSMSSVAAVYDRRLERAGIRAAGEVARRIRPAQAGRRPQGRASYSSAKPLIKDHNVVLSFSPRLAVQRHTPGKLSHKIQPPISRDCGLREARIKIAATFPKIQNSKLNIQHCFPHPPTNPHSKSTLAHPKSTIDLGCERLIRVENGPRSPLSPTCYRPISGPKIRESNQNQTVTGRKIYRWSLCRALSVGASYHPLFSTLVLHPFASHCQPMPSYANHPLPPCLFPPGGIKNPYHRNFSVQSYSKQFKAIQGFLDTFFYFHDPSQ